MRTFRLKAERIALLTLALVLYPVAWPTYWFWEAVKAVVWRLAQFGHWLAHKASWYGGELDSMPDPTSGVLVSPKGLRRWHLDRLNAIHAELHKDRVIH
tara:strand:- start:837 stop:1133 length:297 start_codon:yes stop_codon:yes gene_type:complete